MAARRTTSRRNATIPLTTYLGAAVLGFILIGSWVPRDCPAVRRVFASCPVDSTRVSQFTPGTDEFDIARIPNQVIDRNLVEFKVPTSENRKTTEASFSYRGDLSKTIAYLALRTSEAGTLTPAGQAPNGNSTGSGIERVALVTHPLLTNLTWPRIGTVSPTVSLYQQNERYGDATELRNNLPPARTLAVDSIIARRWNLQRDEYTLLDELTKLDGISYVVTSYIPPTPDGGWSQFRQVFDSTFGFVDADKELSWYLFTSTSEKPEKPFRTSTISIDYRTAESEITGAE
jgi:hypothetical protein